MATIIDDNLSKILSARYGEEVRGAIHDAIEQCYNNVDSDLNLKYGGNKLLTGSDGTMFDANESAASNSFYQFIVTKDGLKKLANFPSEIMQYGKQIEFILITFGQNHPGSHQLILETHDGSLTIYLRDKEQTWMGWSSVSSNSIFKRVSNNLIKETDANDLVGNNIRYLLLANQLEGVKNKNFPIGVTKGQAIATLISLGQSTGNTQTLITDRDFIAYRTSSDRGGGNWQFNNWTKIGRRKIFVSKNRLSSMVTYGNGVAYNSLLEALIDATSDFDNIVYVYPGEYDLIKEYKNYFGSDFFTTYDPHMHEFARGLFLKNKVTLIFSKGAKVKCMYDGSDPSLSNLFSPFNAGPFGFTLIGADVQDQNVRYSVHDERAESNDLYLNHYIGCHFYHDKGTGNGYKQALGGGLGNNGIVRIEDCMFKSKGCTEYIVSYHNSRSGGGINAESFISIKDSIIDGSVRFGWYGNATNISKMMVTNCRLLSEPIVSRENNEFDIKNVKLYAWNNSIESDPVLS